MKADVLPPEVNALLREHKECVERAKDADARLRKAMIEWAVRVTITESKQ